MLTISIQVTTAEISSTTSQNLELNHSSIKQSRETHFCEGENRSVLVDTSSSCTLGRLTPRTTSDFTSHQNPKPTAPTTTTNTTKPVPKSTCKRSTPAQQELIQKKLEKNKAGQAQQRAKTKTPLNMADVAVQDTAGDSYPDDSNVSPPSDSETSDGAPLRDTPFSPNSEPDVSCLVLPLA